jgi:hypothetical protein
MDILLVRKKHPPAITAFLSIVLPGLSLLSCTGSSLVSGVTLHPNGISHHPNMRISMDEPSRQNGVISCGETRTEQGQPELGFPGSLMML